ncbi:hypothetical protein [Streptomyces sp. NPDC048581]|uniref:hypothetical protein n=1 Tax=unclassified Streptomyces TaxID=2593676 RepID=UPI003716083F
MTTSETWPEASPLVADGAGTATYRRLPGPPYARDPSPDADRAKASADSQPAVAPSSPAQRSTP